MSLISSFHYFANVFSNTWIYSYIYFLELLHIGCSFTLKYLIFYKYKYNYQNKKININILFNLQTLFRFTHCPNNVLYSKGKFWIMLCIHLSCFFRSFFVFLFKSNSSSVFSLCFMTLTF